MIDDNGGTIFNYPTFRVQFYVQFSAELLFSLVSRQHFVQKLRNMKEVMRMSDGGGLLSPKCKSSLESLLMTLYPVWPPGGDKTYIIHRCES